MTTSGINNRQVFRMITENGSNVVKAVKTLKELLLLEQYQTMLTMGPSLLSLQISNQVTLNLMTQWYEADAYVNHRSEDDIDL
jgi:hypothetical protein